MNTLGIVPSVMVWEKNRTFYYDRKFYDGVLEYCRHWKGDVKCLMRVSHSEFPKFGVVEHDESIPFTLEIIDGSRHNLTEKIKSTNIVLVSGDSFDFLHVSQLCRETNTRCVYIIENTLNTRMQIARIECSSRASVRLYIKYLYLLLGEYRRIRAFSRADGLQANGTGSYQTYRSRNNNCILYFDTRIRRKDLIKEDRLSSRMAQLNRRQLHIGYSGRLSSIKGVEDLIEVARILQSRNFAFKLFVYGDGDLYEKLESNIVDYDLSAYVMLKGALPFYDELLPELKDNVDVFVLPHKQGDPSCTYLETLSCGIPIIGYDNEAFAGLMQVADIGWMVKTGDVNSVAGKIIEISNRKEEIAQKSKNAINFAKQNYFENTFAKRMRHLKKILAGAE